MIRMGNKQQKSKRARQHRQEAIGAGIYAGTGHPSHCTDWQRTAQNHSYFSKMIDEGLNMKGGVDMDKICPRCKSNVNESDNFCGKCGESLVENEETSNESTLLEEDR